jgi:hypothetical protein
LKFRIQINLPPPPGTVSLGPAHFPSPPTSPCSPGVAYASPYQTPPVARLPCSLDHRPPPPSPCVVGHPHPSRSSARYAGPPHPFSPEQGQVAPPPFSSMLRHLNRRAPPLTLAAPMLLLSSKAASWVTSPLLTAGSPLLSIEGPLRTGITW